MTSENSQICFKLSFMVLFMCKEHATIFQKIFDLLKCTCIWESSKTFQKIGKKSKKRSSDFKKRRKYYIIHIVEGLQKC